ncbi:MAG: CBS domain-containing protein [Nitrosopumilus sp.]|nr:CBS domain-containing protein [Nitrosopumilus sp.]
MVNLDSIMQKPITITQNFSVQQTILKFLEKKISRLIVIESQSSIGIVTAKDIGLFLLNDESEKSLDSIPVSELMKPIISVDKSTNIKEGAQIMTDKGIGSLGIISDNKLMGIVTKTDLVKYYAENYLGVHEVGDLMTISYVFMNSNELLHKIISRMAEEKISRIFLENKENELEGILTLKDFFPLAIEKGHLNTLKYNDYPETSVLYMGKGFGHTTLAKEIMNNKVVSVDFKDDAVTACAKMIENHISGVEVKTKDKTSGLITKTDVVKAISKIED